MSYLPRTLVLSFAFMLLVPFSANAQSPPADAVPRDAIRSIQLPTGIDLGGSGRPTLVPRTILGSGGETHLPGSNPIPENDPPGTTVGPITGVPTSLPGPNPVPQPDPIPDDGDPNRHYSSVLEINGSGLTLEERTRLSFYVFTELNRRVVFTP